ncbi:MAG: filamentous hemagglutinin N-terminal domain-containing protein [Selenomonadaceae bacterium]|nr:filamentous hemagglutinin N-terminal domain-containing protein [Selenomonadaceae bacterium]
MDRRQREQARLACQISIGLMAGIFSFIPSVSAAPTHDPDSFSGNALTVPAANIKQSGTTTNVNGANLNNIVAWKDFSVSSGEKVTFNDGEKTKNYLNVVTGENASAINGAIKGGKDVYLVNPHGVLIGQGANIDVGNLYVSTQDAQSAVTAFTNDNTGAGVLSEKANAEVVNMGTIKADKVEVHGTVIKFLDLSDVATADMTDGNKLMLNATGKINLGKNQDTSKTNAAYTANRTATIYNVIENQTQLQNIPDNATDNYWLKNDIDTSGIFTPIKGFAGVFDGNFFTVSNLKVDTSADETVPAGLFSTIAGASTSNRAKIRNLGIKPVSIRAANTQYAGGLAGTAVNADINDVFVSGGTIGNETGFEGGILGRAQNVTMDSVYNKANVSGGSGLVAELAGNVEISNAYNAGKAFTGLVTNAYLSDDGQGNTIEDTYDDVTQSESEAAIGGSAEVVPTNVFSIVGTENAADPTNNVYYIGDMKQVSAYSSWSSISENGGENTKWRIYEGQSLPLLRSFLKANGTVTVNYDYQMGDSTYEYRHAGSNGGKDISVVYNHKPLETSNVTYSIASQKGLTNTSGITSVSGLQNVYTNDAKAKAAFYTGQDGYDLVGNNVTITKRSANVGNIPSTPLTKTYDGNANINTRTLKQWLTSGATSTGETDPDTGIIDGDDTVTQDATNLSGKFYLNNSPSKTAGNKDLYIEGSLSVANAGGYYNYAITGDAANFGAVGSGTTLTSTASRVYGKILKKDLILSKKDVVTITREYNGKNHNEVADDYRLKSSDSAEAAKTKSDALFKLDGKVSSTTTTTGDSGTTTTTTEDEVYVTTSDSGTGTYGTLSDGTFTATTNAIVGDYDVAYQNLVLSGADAENYNLVQATTDADGNTVNTAVGTNPFYTKGSITQKTINSDSFVIRTSDGSTTPAQKDYDGTSAYELSSGQTLTSTDVVSYPSTTGGATTYDDVQFTPTSARFTTTTNGVTTDAINKGMGYDITYKVNVSGADAGNYKIVNGSTTTSLVSNTPTLDVDVTGSQGSGTINARKLYLKANKGADKSYDGDDKVTNTDGTLSPKIAFDGSSDGYVVYNYSGDDAAKHKLVGNDKIELSGTYAGGADVSWTGNATDGYTVAPKDITYTVTVKDADGNVSENYEVYNDVSSASSTSTLSGVTGKITPRTIQKVVFADTEKTYDGTNTVNGVQTNDEIKITGVTLEGADNLSTNPDGFIQPTTGTGATVADIFGTDTSNITGKYGTYDATTGTFTLNKRDGETGTQGGHVKRDASGNVVSQDVQYSNVALLNPRGNYVLSSSTQYGEGTINPLTVTSIDVATTGAITKVYDAKTGVATTADGQNSAKTAASYISGLSTTVGGNTINLDYSIADDDANYITDTGTNTKNVVEANKARFLFSVDETGDYTVADSLKESGKVKKDLDASITARTVTAQQNTTPIERDYNGKTAIGRTGEDAVTITGLLSSLDGATNTSTGKFRDKNVAYALDADGNETDTVADKPIDYTITLNNGDTTMQGNYKVVRAGDTTNTALAYNTSGALTGTGKINPLMLESTYGTVTKTYDGTTSIPDGSGFSVTIPTDALMTDDNGTRDTVTITGDQAASQYVDSTTGAGDAANRGTNKKVQYAFTLGGTDMRNYKFATDASENTIAHADTTYTKTTTGNVINVKTLQDSDIDVDWNTVTKTYDGTSNVAYDHSDTNTYFDGERGTKTAADFIKNDDTTTGLKLGGISIARGTNGYTVTGGKYTNDAGTETANVSEATKAKFTFDLSATVLDNFDFSQLTSNVFDGQNTLTKSTSATITPKTFKMDFTPLSGHSQVYNGGTALVDNSQSNITGTPTNLSNTVSNLRGLVNSQGMTELGLSVAGNYVDTTTNGTTIAAKDVGTGKNIQYDVTLQKKNYQFDTSAVTPKTDANGNSVVSYMGNSTNGGTGTIVAKQLSIGFGKVNKIYDTSSDVTSSVQRDGDVQTTIQPNLDGFVSDAEKNLFTNTNGYQKIKGYYVREAADGTIYDDANVEWDSANSQAKDKGVAYTGIAGAFSQLQTDNSVLKNYVLTNVQDDGVTKALTLNRGATNEQTLDATSNNIANTVYFDAAKGKGKIRQLSLTMNDIKTRWNNYSRQYDGTSEISEQDYQRALSLYADSASGVSFANGQSIPILYRGSMNFFDIDTGNERKNAGSNLGIKATITGLGASSSDNNISVAGLNESALYTTYLNTDNGGTTRGTITPRKIVAVSTQTDASKYDKTYSGTKDVEDYANKVMLRHQNDDGTFDDEIIKDNATSVALTGVTYNTKNAGSDRSIDYTADIATTDAVNNPTSNYELVTTNGNQAVLVGANTYTTTTNDDGTTTRSLKQQAGEALKGNINKRTVYVDFTNGTPTNIDKTYGETTITNVTEDNRDTARKEVLNPDTYRNQIDVKAKDDVRKTGIVDEDANDVKLNKSAINAAYDDGKVHRKSDGTADTQNVNFTNFTLTDRRATTSDDYADPMSNYEVKTVNANDTSKLIGKGTISPKDVVVTINNSPNVKKIYDGTNDLSSFTENGATTQNLDTLKQNARIDDAQMMLGESVNDLGFDITGGSYASKHTNATNDIDDGTMGVNYNASWTNKNYNLTFKPLNAEDTDAGASHPLTVTATSNPSTTQDANGNDVNRNGTATFTVNQGTISPKTLTVTGGQATKVYDGEATQNGTFTGLDTPDNTSSAVRFDGIVDSDKNAGTTIATGTATYYDKDGTSFDPNAGWADKPGLRDHKVKWNLELQDKDYSLNTTTPEGAGTITRATLTLTGDKQNITTESTPSYDGKTTGWQGNDEKDEDLQKKWKALLKWYSNPGEDTSQAGQYAVNGWYKNAKGDKTITNSTDITTETDEGGNTFETATTTYWNGTSDVASTVTRMLITEVPDPDDSTKTVKKKTLVSTTKTIKNPFNSDVYTTVTDAAGKVTSMTLTKTAADGTTTTTPVKSIADWYGSVTDAQTGTAYAYDSTDEPTTLSTYTLSGNFDKNYKIAQYAGDGTSTNPGNAKALTVSNPSHGGPVTPSMPTDVPDISEMNAAKRFVPDTHAYNYASHDELQSVTRSGKAGLEYASGGINVTGETTTSSDVNVTSSDLSAIGVQGAGSVVNLSGGNATEVSASRVDLTGGDTFTITGDTQVKEGAASIETTGAQTKDGSAAIESTGAQTREGTAAVETTDLQSTTDSSWLFGDEAPASERQSETSSSEDDGTSLFANAYDDDEATARSAISVKTADDVDDADDAETKDDDERKDAESSDASDESSIGIESEGSAVNVAS